MFIPSLSAPFFLGMSTVSVSFRSKRQDRRNAHGGGAAERLYDSMVHPEGSTSGSTAALRPWAMLGSARASGVEAGSQEAAKPHTTGRWGRDKRQSNRIDDYEILKHLFTAEQPNF